MADQIQVLIAEDHRLFREGLRLILAREEEIAVVGEASDGRKAVDLAGRLKPLEFSTTHLTFIRTLFCTKTTREIPS